MVRTCRVPGSSRREHIFASDRRQGLEQKTLWIIYINPDYPKCGDMFTAVKTTPRQLEKDIAFVKLQHSCQVFIAQGVASR
jgi:hypothetical protein